jgi:predicted DNA-binding transcriptional regulator AlpA
MGAFFVTTRARILAKHHKGEAKYMPTETRSEIDDLRARLRRLEDAAARPRGRTNLPGAARYLGVSEETLRNKHKQEKGPPRKRVGTRNWSYSYSDLDAWIAAQEG